MTPRSVKKAAAVSQVMLVLWVIQSTGVYLFQDVVLYSKLNIVPPEGSGRVVYTAGFLYPAAGILIAIADILMQKGKCVYAPLIISAVTTGGLPLAVRMVSSYQLQMTAVLKGSEELTVLSFYGKLADAFAYLIYAAAIVTIAASAVYSYACNRDKKNPTQE